MGLDHVLDVDVAGAFTAQDAEADHRTAIESRKGARLRNAVRDSTDIVEPHIPAARQRNAGRREVGHRSRPRERAYRLIAAPDLGPPAGKVGIAAAQLTAHINRSNTDPLQRNRVESDPDLGSTLPILSMLPTPRMPCSLRTTTSSTKNEICS